MDHWSPARFSIWTRRSPRTEKQEHELDGPNSRAWTHVTRRHFFGRTSTGIGVMALASLLNPQLFAADERDPKTGGLPGLPHFAPNGEAGHLPASIGRARRRSICSITSRSWTKYRRHRTARLHAQGPADHRHDLGPELACRLRRPSSSSSSMARPAPGSANCCRIRPRSSTTSRSSRPSTPTRSITIPAITFIQTGIQQPGRPSMGAWVSYGLGSENQNLPAFVVLISQAQRAESRISRCSRASGASGFLPSKYQGVRFRASGDPVLYLANPDGIDATVRARRCSTALQKLNRMHRTDIRRSGNRDAHRAVRDGVSHADRRCRI